MKKWFAFLVEIEILSTDDYAVRGILLNVLVGKVYHETITFIIVHVCIFPVITIRHIAI